MAGNTNSGRKAKTIITRELEVSLKESSLVAGRLLKWSLRGHDDKGRKFKPLSMTRIKECELVIAHAIGTPRQKIDLHQTGELYTIHDLARLIKEKERPKELPEPNPELLLPGQAIDVIPVEVKQDAEHKG